MTLEEAEKLKKVQLEIMDEIDRICEDNNICYYIVGGTLIGAIRHKGFIPWDVDMDIAMPRKEYDRFKRICSDQLDIKYQYCDYTNVENYDRPHAVVCVKNTKLISIFYMDIPKAQDHFILCLILKMRISQILLMLSLEEKKFFQVLKEFMTMIYY